MLSAKIPTSLPLTSDSTPRPNCAALPVTFRLVRTVTWVWSPSGTSSERTVADAVPEPRVSLPDASSVTTWASRFRSVKCALPA